MIVSAASLANEFASAMCARAKTLDGIYQVRLPVYPKESAGKRNYCGSREFRAHNSVEICAYCRVERA